MNSIKILNKKRKKNTVKTMTSYVGPPMETNVYMIKKFLKENKEKKNLIYKLSN